MLTLTLFHNQITFTIIDKDKIKAVIRVIKFTGLVVDNKVNFLLMLE